MKEEILYYGISQIPVYLYFSDKIELNLNTSIVNMLHFQIIFTLDIQTTNHHNLSPCPKISFTSLFSSLSFDEVIA